MTSKIIRTIIFGCIGLLAYDIIGPRAVTATLFIFTLEHFWNSKVHT